MRAIFFNRAGKFTTERPIGDNACTGLEVFWRESQKSFLRGRKTNAFTVQTNQYVFYSKFENENLASCSILKIFFIYLS